MSSHKTAARTLVLGLLVTLACGQPDVAATGDPEARKTKILENLKLHFPQLEELNVTMGELKPSGLPGVDLGSFIINEQQTQEFLVSGDDQKLYLISGNPINVSLTLEEIEVARAQRAEEEAKEAAEREKKLAAAVAGLPVRGNANGSVTVVEFSDFQCPYCARASETIDQLVAKYPDKVKVVFKHFPLDFHPWAKSAAIAAHCAGQQDGEAFWTLHDAYFKNQGQLTTQNLLTESKGYLDGTGIDMAAWSTCAEDTTSETYKAAAATVDADMALGTKLGVSGTPAFFVNGHFLSGAQPLTAFDSLIAQGSS